jgi:signal transduction histidine kinase
MSQRSQTKDQNTSLLWSSHINALSEIGVGAVVVEMRNISVVRERIRALADAVIVSKNHLNLSSEVSSILSQLSTPIVNEPALGLFNLANEHGFSGKMLEFISALPVESSLEILDKVAIGEGEFHFQTSPSLRFNIKIQIAMINQEVLSCLCLVFKDPESNIDVNQTSVITSAFKALSDALILLNVNEDIILHNDAAEKILPILRKNTPKINDVMSPASVRLFSQTLIDVKNKMRDWRGEIELIDKESGRAIQNNSVVTYFHCRNLYGDQGFFVFQVSPRSVPTPSERSAQEEMGRLVSVGRISAQVIHEINNPVTVINGKAEKIQWLVEKPQSQETKAEILDATVKILNMTDRIGKIIKSMKNLTRNAHSEVKAPTAPADLIKEVMDLVEVVAKKNGVKLKFSDSSSNVKIPMQRLRLSQVVVNLANNSIDAVSNLDERWVEFSFTNDSEWVHFHITDSGKGIPSEVKGRLFENYFSTKGAGLGTGIGLPLARSIAREQGGDLYLDESCPNTRFVLKLPLR